MPRREDEQLFLDANLEFAPGHFALPPEAKISAVPKPIMDGLTQLLGARVLINGNLGHQLQIDASGFKQAMHIFRGDRGNI